MRSSVSFIGQPIRSLQTMLRVIAENDPQHTQVVPDGLYGPETVQAISAFQRLHGLPVTGITDQETWEAVVAVYELALIEQDSAQVLEIILNPGQVIRKGERHPHLHLAQGMLAALAEVYSSVGTPARHGLLDESTADALSSFQALSGLPMTGHLDKHTWKHLVLQYILAANLQDLGSEVRDIEKFL